MTKQTKTNNSNYLIDTTFNKVNRLFVLSFEDEEDRTSFSKYYMPKAEIKDLNVSNDGKRFFRCASKKQRNNIRKNMKYVKIIIIQLTIYWIIYIFQSTINLLK